MEISIENECISREIAAQRRVRTAGLLGDAAMDRLAAASVAVFGLGGVGSYVAEALARAGIGRLILVDGDAVAASNMNRQLIADTETVGMRKTEAAAARVRRIAPDCTVETCDIFYLPETAGAIDFRGLSYAVDAVDTVSAKIAIIENARRAGVPVISSMGTGNKLHPELFELAPIEKTSVCPLARVMRRELKQRGITGVQVVYSREEPVTAGMDGETGRPVPASVSFVPGAAGLILAGAVIREIAGV